MADHSGVDVVIVGAGPVGSALAIALGRSGLQTVVLERDTFPRDKPCGEAIQPSGVAALAHLGIDLAAAGGWPLKGIRYRMPGHESVTASFGQERLGYGIPRRRLDELIAYAAASTPGVTVETSVEMTDLAVGPAGVTLETNRGSITTPVLVAADGMRSNVALRLGWRQSPHRSRYGLAGHLWAPDHGLTEGAITLLGSRQLMVTPVAHNELAAVLLWSGELNQPTDSIHDTFLAAVEDAQMPIDAILADGPHGIGPFWVRPDRVAQGPVFLIGDAAGFTDPIIGDGLASGLAAALALAGMLAAGRTDAVSRYRSWESREWLRRRSLATVTLGLVRSKVRAARALAGFSRHPEALSSFLELNDGARPLRDLKLSDWTALLGR